MKIFFTYVWGAPGDPAWPLTFANKAARRHAKNELSEGDLVFTIGTKSEPTPPMHWGRVAGVYRVSDLEINTQDYGMSQRDQNLDHDGTLRFPFALHPLEVWEVNDPNNVFYDLVGPLTPGVHWQAQSRVVELDKTTAHPLLALSRVNVTPAEPKTEFGKGLVRKKMSKLAPKHSGRFSGEFGDHDIWYVYTLVLRKDRHKTLAVKVGYSHNPSDRKDAYNKSLAREVSGLYWSLDCEQPIGSEDAARDVEQAVLDKYRINRLESNGEILQGIDPIFISASISSLMRDMRID